MKKLLGTLLALPMLMSAGQAKADTHFGEYKVKIKVVNAEKWKVRWLCNEADGTTSVIDGDTYPASTGTTRSTNITAAKCSTGDWKIEFQLKKLGNWKDVRPGADVCNGNSTCGYTDDAFTFETYARPNNFNGNNKLCLEAHNIAYNSVYVAKVGC